MFFKFLLLRFQCSFDPQHLEQDDPEQLERHVVDEQRDADETLKQVVLTLWYTRMVRSERLRVIDEVKNGINYFRSTFFTELPRLHGDTEDLLLARFPDHTWALPPFLRVGSWIGGDRDGNPFVTAGTLRETGRLQASATIEFYLEEVHALGFDLPLSERLVAVTAELSALAARSPDTSAQRLDEPYRRALIGIYARLAATAQALGLPAPIRQAIGTDAPYATSVELGRDLAVIRDSLTQHGGTRLTTGRLRRLSRAVELFGFHLAPLDVRQNSEVHERVVRARLDVLVLAVAAARHAQQASMHSEHAGRRSTLHQDGLAGRQHAAGHHDGHQHGHEHGPLHAHSHTHAHAHGPTHAHDHGARPVAPSPVVELNRAMAIAMAYGPERGLELVEDLADEASNQAIQQQRGDCDEKPALDRAGQRHGLGGLEHGARMVSRSAAGVGQNAQGKGCGDKWLHGFNLRKEDIRRNWVGARRYPQGQTAEG